MGDVGMGDGTVLSDDPPVPCAVLEMADFIARVFCLVLYIWSDISG